MNLFRFVILALGAYLIWRLIQRGRTAALHREPPPHGTESFEPMQRCKGCGTYLPASSLSRSGHCGRCSE